MQRGAHGRRPDTACFKQFATEAMQGLLRSLQRSHPRSMGMEMTPLSCDAVVLSTAGM